MSQYAHPRPLAVHLRLRNFDGSCYEDGKAIVGETSSDNHGSSNRSLQTA